jgi:hypothetical protein
MINSRIFVKKHWNLLQQFISTGSSILAFHCPVNGEVFHGEIFLENKSVISAG